MLSNVRNQVTKRHQLPQNTYTGQQYFSHMDVLLTGANGTVGEAIMSQLGDRKDYDFTCLDINENPNRETVVADITDYDAIRPHFDDHDAVIHLAGVPDVNGSWDD